MLCNSQCDAPLTNSTVGAAQQLTATCRWLGVNQARSATAVYAAMHAGTALFYEGPCFPNAQQYPCSLCHEAPEGTEHLRTMPSPFFVLSRLVCLPQHKQKLSCTLQGPAQHVVCSGSHRISSCSRPLLTRHTVRLPCRQVGHPERHCNPHESCTAPDGRHGLHLQQVWLQHEG